MTLYEKVLRDCGIAAIIADGALYRACVRAGVPKEMLTRVSLRKVLPHFRKTLETYLPPHEVVERMALLEALTRTSSGLVRIPLEADELDDD